MTKRTIVVTGACGYIAQRMWPELSERYDLVVIIGEQLTHPIGQDDPGRNRVHSNIGMRPLQGKRTG